MIKLPKGGASQVALVVKNHLPMQETIRDVGLIPESGRSAGERGNPFQNSHLDNPTDRRAWQATVCRVSKSWARLSDFLFHIYTSKPNNISQNKYIQI